MFKINALMSLLLLATACGCRAQNATIAAPQSSAPQTTVTAGVTAGDRRPAINCIYPSEAMFHNGKGGTVLDITQAPFGAKGDGTTDDTQAFVRAYDFVLREQDKIGYSSTAMLNTHSKNFAHNTEGYPSDGPVKSNDSSFIIYIPNGTYLVSDTLIYSMADRTPSKRRDVFLRGDGEPKETNTGWERVIWIRFIGQNRDKTVIRLRDNAPGFGAGQNKAVVAYGKSTFNNRKAMNALRNLTVDTGSGNAGAVAVDFTGANKAQISNVTLRSGDGQGAHGLLLKRPPVIGYHHDITIEGFDYGLTSRIGHASAPVYEWITLKNQNKAGVLLTEDAGDKGTGQASVSMRQLRSEGRAPAARLEVDGGHLVMLDSVLNGNDATQPAFDLEQGQLFLSNVETRGYAATVKSPTAPVATGRVAQYVSGRALAAGQTTPLLQRLPVREAPEVLWPDANQWATPAQFGARADGTTDDTQAIQAALDSGKPWVFLTQGKYRVSAPLRVPASVRVIDGMFRYNPGLDFEVSQSSAEPLRFSDTFRGQVRHYSARPVVMDMAESSYTNTTAARGSVLYLLNGAYPTQNHNKAKLNVYAWSMNNEGRGLPITSDGAQAWILGLKAERGPTLRLLNGARVEIYGATIGVHPGDPAIRIEDSQLVLVANSSAGNWDNDKIAITEVRGGKETQVKVSELPLREKGATKEETPLRIVPFYVSGAGK